MHTTILEQAIQRVVQHSAIHKVLERAIKQLTTKGETK